MIVSVQHSSWEIKCRLSISNYPSIYRNGRFNTVFVQRTHQWFIT